jgi:hypothetical protein
LAALLMLAGCADSGIENPSAAAGGAQQPTGDSPSGPTASADDGLTATPTGPTAGGAAGGDAPAPDEGGDTTAPGDGSLPPAGGGDGVTGPAPVQGRAPGLEPLQVAPGYADLSVPLGEPLPDAPPGEWVYTEIEGAYCRDGSPAGLFYKYSATSTNYFVFLEGGGACFDDFFCPLNPQNVDEKVDGESILQAALLNFGGAAEVPQTPHLDGMFKDDPRNPVADWNGVYVPYCSGDVYGGTRESAPVPRWPAGGEQRFTGYENVSLMASRVVATFRDAEKALLTGSSAGGVGSLVNAGQLADTLAAHTNTRGFIVSDSGPVFDDPYLETCIQKEWRELWGLQAAFPPDCEGCFNQDGGGIVRGLGRYLFEKYDGDHQVVGGLISSYDDEIMTMFFSKGLDGCNGSLLYPAGRYRAGLENFRDEIVDPSRFATYFMAGSFHMHLMEPRFYEENGVGMSIADWLGKLLDNEVVHANAQ